MEKVKVTREQAEAVDALREIAKEMLVVDLLRAIKEGYEVEPEYKPGDWIVRIKSNMSGDLPEGLVFKVTETACTKTVRGDNGRRHIKDNIRHATPGEIKAEQERRVWAKIGRRPREFRLGDAYENNKGIIYTFDKPGRINAIEDMYDRGSLKGIYPAESFISFGGWEE